MLTVRDVHKSYAEVNALRGVSLDIEPGEVVGLLGPNGAGKTTLVSLVAGLRQPDSGSISVNGIDVLIRPKDACTYIGLAPQDLGIYPVISVRENLEIFGELAGVRGRDLKQRIESVGEMLMLAPIFDRLVRTLSSGERRRLHTASALLHRPPLLLLDEPTAGADVRTRAAILEVVRKLASNGSAVLYSTHYLHEIEILNASVALLLEGEIIARGALDGLIAAHARPVVELTFNGPAPRIRSSKENTSVNGSVLRITTDHPGSAVATALGKLGKHSGRLRGLQIIRPSLESVFLSLTGRRYEEYERGADPHVPAT